ncbi:hypothetical protein RhiirB3_493090 [Rhizophagus irregularis]|nr:hypothetical protein RhiirB3_493090 [Rhizophagus irregularis]
MACISQYGSEINLLHNKHEKAMICFIYLLIYLFIYPTFGNLAEFKLEVGKNLNRENYCLDTLGKTDMNLFHECCMKDGLIVKESMMFQVQKNDNPNEQLLVTFPDEKPVGVKYLKILC